METVRAQAVKSGDTTEGSEKWAFEAKITNTSFKPIPALQAQYIVFVERQELGKKKGLERIEKVKGTAEIKPIAAHGNSSFTTETVSLSEKSLNGSFHYVNGGLIKSKDSLKGIWIKLMDGTTVVGEYVNPSTLQAKEQW